MNLKQYFILVEYSSSYGGKKSSYFSTDESEVDVSAKATDKFPKDVNKFGHCKTSRYNRPPRDKKVLDEREKIATRRSSRIKELMEEKKKLDAVRTYLFTKVSCKYCIQIFHINIRHEYSTKFFLIIIYKYSTEIFHRNIPQKYSHIILWGNIGHKYSM